MGVMVIHGETWFPPWLCPGHLGELEQEKGGGLEQRAGWSPRTVPCITGTCLWAQTPARGQGTHPKQALSTASLGTETGQRRPGLCSSSLPWGLAPGGAFHFFLHLSHRQAGPLCSELVPRCSRGAHARCSGSGELRSLNVRQYYF